MEDIVEDFLTDGTYYSLSELSCGGVPPKVSGSDLSFKNYEICQILLEYTFLTFCAFKTLSTPAFSRRQSVSKPTC